VEKKERTMRIDSIAGLLDPVREAGKVALEKQKKLGREERRYKADDSVITPVDKEIEDFLSESIRAVYPEANILAEETHRSFEAANAYTFALDPIDGTDVFSQGMPSWSISVGLLDRLLNPIAGIIYAPALECLVFADIGGRAMRNGAALALPKKTESLSPRTNIMVSSRIHKQADLQGYPGRIRSIGSCALHLIAPLIYPGVSAALEGAGVHIWDIAGAHAINRALGLDFEFLEGGRVEYRELIDGSPVRDVLLAGYRDSVNMLKKVVKKI
jgi:fructose-1,6-bisphosphatase/inositol monophosphatase family enzyme